MVGNLNERQIAKKAQKIREDIIRSLVAAGSGHSGGPLGLADIFAALFFSILHYNRTRYKISEERISK